MFTFYKCKKFYVEIVLLILIIHVKIKFLFTLMHAESGNKFNA